MDVSVGGYSLEGYNEIGKLVPRGFNVNLNYKRRNLATLGLGEKKWSNIRFNDSLTDKEKIQIQEDMELLVTRLKPVLDPEETWKIFLGTPQGAARGFIHVLMELNKITKMATKVSKSGIEGGYYVVGLMGDSWLSPSHEFTGKTYYPTKGSFKTKEEAIEYVNTHIIPKESEKGKLRALAILDGGFNWGLTFKDYASFYRVNEI